MADTAVSSVQIGQKIVSSADSSDTVTISSVDTTKSVLFYSVRMSEGSGPDEERIVGELTDSTTLTFTKRSSGLDIIVEWKVVEFSSGVSVQRGSITGASSTEDVTITNVSDTTKCFVLVNSFYDDSSYNRTPEVITGYLSSTTNLRLECGSGNTNGIWVWQVVKIDNASVQTGEFTMTTISATATISSVTTSKSFVVSGARDSAAKVNGPDDWSITCDLTNSTTVTAYRKNNARDLVVRYHVVSLSDTDFSVQRNLESITSTSAQNITISSVDTDRSVPIVGGKGNFSAITSEGSTSNGLHHIGTTLILTSSTNLQVENEGYTSGDDVDLYWQVLEFPGEALAVIPMQIIWIPSIN